MKVGYLIIENSRMLSEKRFAWTPVPYAAARWLHSVHRIRVSPTERYKVYHKIRQMTEKFTFKNDYDIHIVKYYCYYYNTATRYLSCPAAPPSRYSMRISRTAPAELTDKR